MRNLAKMLIAGTTLLTLTAPVYAADTSVLNGQVNLADVFANNNLDIAHIGKTVTATATAVGNTVEIVTMQDSHVLNNQVATGNIAAALNVKASDIHGDVTFTSTALCNGASVSTDPTVTDVRSSQTCGVAPTPVMPPRDPSATTWVNLVDVKGNATIGATAVSNQLQIDSNASNFPVNNMQTNFSRTVATTGANIYNVTGAVTSNATAVGNTAQIIHWK